MGSFFSNKKSSTTTSSGDPIKQEAWGIAKPLYQTAIGGGQQFFNEYANNPAFSGQRVAGLDPFQTGSANSLGGFAGQFTPAAQGAAAGLGFSNIGAGANFGSNAQGIFNQFSGDPTQQILGAAGQYANNPYVDGLINASSRDVVRNLYENDLTGAGLRATGTGNTNSTRAGVESAILQRGAADRLADMSSNIRSQFFGQGLGMAQNQYNQNLSNMLQANQGLMQAGQFGMDALGGAQNFASTGFNQGQAAGGVFQGQNQAELDANKSQFDEGFANRMQLLGSLNQLSQGGAVYSGGPTSTSGVTRERPSGAQIAGSLIGSFFSDIRMKENIKQVGSYPSGLPLYKFDYKPEFKDVAGHGTFYGVMAQEAEVHFPEAVSVAANGYKMVDYSKVR
jgi:hypothetical protein